MSASVIELEVFSLVIITQLSRRVLSVSVESVCCNCHGVVSVSFVGGVVLKHPPNKRVDSVNSHTISVDDFIEI